MGGAFLCLWEKRKMDCSRICGCWWKVCDPYLLIAVDLMVPYSSNELLHDMILLVDCHLRCSPIIIYTKITITSVMVCWARVVCLIF